ncbi:MAG: DUF2505 domain-containing protein [Spirochaetia bacterium]|nr:DUF2505 domain-containing protein [Spirochaetia bacterium]
MKKITVKQEFDAGLKDLLRAREERYTHLDKFPELKNIHILSEEKDGKLLRQKREIVLTDSLPAAITPFLKSGGITLIENSEFNEEENLHTFTVEPGSGMDSSFFKIKGISRYYSLDESRSCRDYEIEIESSAFLVGAVVETAIGEIYHHNLEKDKKSISNFIQMFQEEKGAS